MTIRRVLVLGGTREGREVAARLSGLPGLEVTTSLAGRVRDPRLPVGDVRIGGFGGATGLTSWLRGNRIDALIDATHPFASAISHHAAAAAHATATPAIILQRPAWQEREGDRWHRVPDMAAAASSVPSHGHRAFLTIGRQDVGAFADVAAVWFLIRSIEPPLPPLPAHHELLLARGPFAVEAELSLLAGQRIEVLVTKDSGGSATSAKLDAARRLGLPVVMVARPDLPAGVGTVASVPAVVEWLDRTLAGGQVG